ncbi:Imm72 family immunity protein [Paraburkholderia aspalathi]|uniref:Imm72 family immunity protein n=1 Tax=Paraburkholderia aspalathi TaxID=1324617 RepID=UPI0038BA4DB6
MTVKLRTYDMQDDETRRRVFWLLKRLTSYTLWKRKRDAWQAFAKAYEHAVNTWPKEQPEQMRAEELPGIAKVQQLYDDGLARLAKGQRDVWRWGNSLQEAHRLHGVIAEFLYAHPDYWERGHQEAEYPPKVEQLHKLIRAGQYQGDHAALEVLFGKRSWAYWRGPETLLNRDAYEHSFYTSRYPVFPDSLEPVPEGSHRTIWSGQSVPVDGIWEPVAVDQKYALYLFPMGEKRLHNNGCFNYLVSKTKAPNHLASSTDPKHWLRCDAVHWRLLWEDTRYCNGVVPDESEYFKDDVPDTTNKYDRLE